MDDDGVAATSCCCFLNYCVCWPISCVISFILSLIVFICIASLIVFGMLRSNDVKFHVEGAKLTQFSLDPVNNNLHYNLSLNVFIRNSKSNLGIHYDRFKAMAYYNDKQLGMVTVPSFYQGNKNTTVLETLKFVGQNLVLVDGQKKFEDDRKIGVYRIDVKLKIRSRIMFYNMVTWPMKPIVRCHLKVPFGSSNSSGGFDFQSTKCQLDF